MLPFTTPLDRCTFVAVDVETTGLDPKRDAIVEIGAVRITGGTITAEWDSLVYIDRTIPLDAQRVHGISNRMLVGQPRIGEAMARLLTFVGEGALVEHSHKAFDVAFLEQAYGRPLDAPYLNTCSLSRKLFPHLPSHSLENCCRRFGIANPNAHRALSDARATGELFLKLLELCGTRYPTLADLSAVASVERGAPAGSSPRRRRRVSS